jgi:hypothetical protein
MEPTAALPARLFRITRLVLALVFLGPGVKVRSGD